MKKLLFLLIAIFSLCSCSSDGDDVNNVVTYEGQTRSIKSVEMDSKTITIYTNDNYWFKLYSTKIKLGKKIYLIADEEFDSEFVEMDTPTSGFIRYTWDYNNISKDSYIIVKGNKEDNRYHIEIFLTDNKKNISVTYLGTPKLGYMED